MLMKRWSARNIECDSFDMLLSIIRMALVNLLSLLLALDGLAEVLAPCTPNGAAFITIEPRVSSLADVAITRTILISLVKRKATGGQSG